MGFSLFEALSRRKNCQSWQHCASKYTFKREQEKERGQEGELDFQICVICSQFSLLSSDGQPLFNRLDMQSSNCGILDVQVAHKAMNHGSQQYYLASLQRGLDPSLFTRVQQWRIYLGLKQAWSSLFKFGKGSVF